MSVEREWASWSHAWLSAAADRAEQARRDEINGEVAGMMCILALHNAVVGAYKVLPGHHCAIETFGREVPDLKQVRDMLTHFDEYIAGDEQELVILTRTGPDQDQASYAIKIHHSTRSTGRLVEAALMHAGGPTDSELLKRLRGAD